MCKAYISGSFFGALKLTKSSLSPIFIQFKTTDLELATIPFQAGGWRQRCFPARAGSKTVSTWPGPRDSEPWHSLI